MKTFKEFSMTEKVDWDDSILHMVVDMVKNLIKGCHGKQKKKNIKNHKNLLP